jgi:hypothetical protein
MELSMGSLNGWLGPLLSMELSMGSLNGWLAGPTFIDGIIDKSGPSH